MDHSIDHDEKKLALLDSSQPISQINTRSTSREQTDRDFVSLANTPNTAPIHSDWTCEGPIGTPITTEISHLLDAAKAAGVSVRFEGASESFISPSITRTKTYQRKDPTSGIVNRSSFAFPTVLHYLLERAEEEAYDVIISWQYHGRSFQVHDPDMFVSKIMPHFFQQTRFSSFLRQLALYDFQRFRQKDHPEFGSYYHEMFLRGMPQLCQSMSRVRAKGPVKRVPANEPDFSKMSIVGLKSKGRDTSRQQLSQNNPILYGNTWLPLPENKLQSHQLRLSQDQISSFPHLSYISHSVEQQHTTIDSTYPQLSGNEISLTDPSNRATMTLEQNPEQSQLRSLFARAMNQKRNENEPQQAFAMPSSAAAYLETLQQEPRAGGQIEASLFYPSNNTIAIQQMTAPDRMSMPQYQFPAGAASFESQHNLSLLSADEIARIRGVVHNNWHQTPPTTFNDSTLQSMALLHSNRIETIQQRYVKMLNQAVLDQFQNDMRVNRAISMQRPILVQPGNVHRTTEGSLTHEQQQSLLLSHQSFLDEAQQGDLLWDRSLDDENDRNGSRSDEPVKSKKQKR